MMCTCHTLFNLGIPLFLKDLHIRYSMRPPRLQLYRFHLLQNPARFSNVTSLTSSHVIFKEIFSPEFDPGVPRLPGCLQYLTGLQVLDMSIAGRHVDTAFCQWIYSLKDLHTLRLHVGNDQVGQQLV